MPKRPHKHDNDLHNTEDHDSDYSEAREISKSQRKRDMHALQELGKQLVELPKDQFEKIILEENLRDAVIEARHIHQHGARKRQLQYIGKIMRGVDAEPIKEQLDTIQGHSTQATQNLHNIERWRERLLEEGDHALKDLIQQHPETDRQYVRQLTRNAKKEMKENKPPKSARLLFRYLRDLISS